MFMYLYSLYVAVVSRCQGGAGASVGRWKVKELRAMFRKAASSSGCDVSGQGLPHGVNQLKTMLPGMKKLAKSLRGWTEGCVAF